MRRDFLVELIVLVFVTMASVALMQRIQLFTATVVTG